MATFPSNERVPVCRNAQARPEGLELPTLGLEVSRAVRAGPPRRHFLLVRPDIEREIRTFVLACGGPCGYIR